MADFLGTRDSNVAISEDNAGRKVLILDTITQVDSLVGNPVIEGIVGDEVFPDVALNVKVCDADEFSNVIELPETLRNNVSGRTAPCRHTRQS